MNDNYKKNLDKMLPTVCVLMSTYNGEKYLEDQIDSILNQKDVTVKLFARDDGSTDNTLNILDTYKSKGLLDYYTGDNLGSERSFLDLLSNSEDFDYYAFSDQDDVWIQDKLYSAVNSIANYSDVPALYYCWPKIVDDKLDEVESYSFHFEDRIESVVIATQNLGCTMCFNRVLRDYLNLYSPKVIAGHDAWTIRVCCCLDGVVVQDAVPHILYRQHDENVVGAIGSYNNLWKRRIRRLKEPKNVRLKIIEELIEGYKDAMPKNNLDFLKSITRYKTNFITRFSLIRNSQLKFYNKDSRFAFVLSVLLGWY